MNVNNHYVSARQMRFSLMEGWWNAAGTQASHKRANNLTDNRGEPI